MPFNLRSSKKAKSDRVFLILCAPVTKSSIQRDPSLDYYTGYQDITEDTNTFNTFDIGHDGDDDVQRNKNRQKLAKRFKRPTTWRDYCTLVSTNNCSIPDEIVDRAPAEDGSENGRYFVEGSYTGHFRATDKNNCTKTKNCTGHFMDFRECECIYKLCFLLFALCTFG